VSGKKKPATKVVSKAVSKATVKAVAKTTTKTAAKTTAKVAAKRTAKVASAKKRSSKESKKRKAAEPAAAKKAKVAKKSPTNKKAVAKDAPPRAHHVTAKMEATWKERLEMLKEHKAKYGTVDLTVAEKGEVDQRLRSFVFEQRKQHKNFMRGRHSTLNAERIQELEDLGFVFDPMGSGTQKANTMRRFQQQWDEMYDELVQYKNEHGTTLVPLGLKAKVEVSRNFFCMIYSQFPYTHPITHLIFSFFFL